MKIDKVITTITLMLAIAILVLASFFGAYKLKIFKVSNIIPDYLLGMEFEDKKVISYEVDTSEKDSKIYDSEGNLVEKEEGKEYTEENGYTTVSEPVNDKEKLNKENYEKVKSIFTKRLYSLGVEQYIIRLDEETGKITVEIPENDIAEDIFENLGQTGEFSIADYETKEELLNQDSLKSAQILYNTGEEGKTTVYLNLKFDEEGTKKLDNISETYVKTEAPEEVKNETAENQTNESSDDTVTEEEENIKYVSMLFNGETYIEKTYFSEKYADGNLYLTFGTSDDTKELQEYIKKASTISNNLNSGVLPVVYTSSEKVYESNISKDVTNIALYIFAGLNLVSFIYLIIRFKKAGFVAIMLQLGYIATLLIMLRITNVVITLEGIVGIIISIILNYIFINMAFNRVIKEDKTMKEVAKSLFGKFAIRTIPIYLIAVIFTFTSLLYSSSLGMTLVWGSIILYLYNLIFTNILLRIVMKED